MKKAFLEGKSVVLVILYYLFAYLATFLPLIVLDFPFWLTLIIIVIVTSFAGFLPVDLALLGLWVWAFIVALNGPQDILAILTYIFFGIKVLLFLIPIVSELMSKKET